jgi:hypothetical protein
MWLYSQTKWLQRIQQHIACKLLMKWTWIPHHCFPHRVFPSLPQVLGGVAAPLVLSLMTIHPAGPAAWPSDTM